MEEKMFIKIKFKQNESFFVNKNINSHFIIAKKIHFLQTKRNVFYKILF
jgi:hypothetical protein